MNAHPSWLSLAQARTEYRYCRLPGLPAHVRELPDAQALPRDTQRYIDNGFRRIALNRLVNLALRRGRAVRTVEDMTQLYRLFSDPGFVLQLWDDDAYWGWTHLAGTNPMQLFRLDALDEDWAVRDAHVAGLLPAGLGLNALVRERRLFATDYRVLHGVQRMQGRWLAEPRCLLWLDERQTLTPLAIQLFPGADQAVFTPAGPRWDWRIARAWAQCASNHTHQALYHLLETHHVPELVALATQRNLPAEHPVHRLLEPHLRQVMGINTLARELLLSPGGMVDRAMASGAEGAREVMRRGWDAFHLEHRGLDEDIRRRGLEELPVFPYRDDGRRVLRALEAYTQQRVQRAYASDDAVRIDPHLRAWREELSSPDALALPGVPALTGRLALSRLLAALVFRATAQHHAMNRGQYEAYGFVPFTPAALYRPPELRPGEGSERLFFDSLPDLGHSLSQLGSAFLLSRPAHTPMSELQPGALATAEDAAAVASLRRELRRVSAEIGRDNRQRYLPYTHLDPAQMATCVDI
ncbi:MAG: hypothetical protein H6741_24305 [Alphaproteobacteria bacterium]|nr:hypothetical protein [Alphaproteobacteria bacterium]